MSFRESGRLAVPVNYVDGLVGIRYTDRNVHILSIDKWSFK